MARLQSRSRTRSHSRKRSKPRRATRSRKRSPNRRSRSRKRSRSRSRSRKRSKSRSRSRSKKRSGKKSLTLAEQRKRGIIPPLPGRLPNGRSRQRKLSPSKKRELARKRKLFGPRRTRSKYRGDPRDLEPPSRRRTRSRSRGSRGSRPSGLPIPEDTEPPTQRLPPKDRKGMSPKQLGHGVSTEWIKDTFIVKIKRRDGTTIKFIPPLAIMTGVSKKTGKPTTRRIGMNDLDSLTKKQQEILSRY